MKLKGYLNEGKFNYTSGFKKVKKGMAINFMNLYDDSIVVCYDEKGKETYKGVLDYSPFKEYENEDFKVAVSDDKCIGVFADPGTGKVVGYWTVIG